MIQSTSNKLYKVLTLKSGWILWKRKSMKDNDVWKLVELSSGVKPIGCKWTFKTKRDSQGEIKRSEARLVTKDFTQRKALITKRLFLWFHRKTLFRVIVALVTHLDLKLHQMDVKTVFLNANIVEMIYMVQLEKFVTNNSKSMVCKFDEIHL